MSQNCDEIILLNIKAIKYWHVSIGIGLDELNTYRKNQKLVSFAEKVLAKELLRKWLLLQGVLLGQRTDKDTELCSPHEPVPFLACSLAASEQPPSAQPFGLLHPQLHLCLALPDSTKILDSPCQAKASSRKGGNSELISSFELLTGLGICLMGSLKLKPGRCFENIKWFLFLF